MVARGADHHHGRVNIHQRHSGPGKAVLTRGQRIVQEQRGQILVVHAGRQACLVRIPAHQVKAAVFFAHQIAACIAGPDQVLGSQELKGASHLLAREIALLIHALAQMGQLLFVDKHAKLAGLREVSLRRQQDHGCQFRQIGRNQRLLLGRAGLLALQTPQRCRHNRQESTTQTVTHGVDAAGTRAVLDGGHGLQHASAQVVLHLQITV